jgi:hypothetical protein
LRDEEFLVKNKPISAIKVQPTKLNEKHGEFLETTLLYDDLQGGNTGDQNLTIKS